MRFDRLKETTKRRGARLSILVALMVIIPGLVAASSYVSGTNSGTLTSATSNGLATDCGWWKDTNLDGFVSAASLSTTYTSGGAAVPTSTSITVTVTSLESSTYQYEEDEIVFGCLDTPAAPATTSITVTIGSATITGATQAVLQITSVEPDAAANPTVGTVCAGSLYPPAATASTSVATADLYTWSAVSHATVVGCGSLSLTFTPAAGTTTDLGLAWISFAFLATGAGGLSASAAFTFTYTATVSG